MGNPASNLGAAELIQQVLLVNGGITFDPASLIVTESPDGVGDLDKRSWGYFQKGTSTFPFDEGILLSTGSAKRSEGPNNQAGFTSILEGEWPGDDDLETILNDVNGDVVETFDATIFQFDFIPDGNTLKFDFIFGSEEYENDFECDNNFRDGFAFLIKGPGINNDSGTAFGGKNIAAVPSSNNIIVNTGSIHDDSFSCGTEITGTNFFPEFYISNSNANNTGVVQFDGYTDILLTETSVIAGETYTIKIIIADRGDNRLDSAVFIRGFATNSNVVIVDEEGSELNFSMCEGEEEILTAQSVDDPFSGMETYEWLLDGVPIIGEVSSTITVSQGGIYSVIVRDDGREFEDSIQVTIIPVLNAGEPGTVDICVNDVAIDLFTILGGTPDIGGIWDPLLTSGTGVFDPVTDAAGIYTYTVTSENNCGTDQATVTVTTIQVPTITLISTNCTDTTYEVIYDVDTESNITTTAGEVDPDGNRIFNIPQGAAIEITANATNLTSCSSILAVQAPDCDCPQIILDNPQAICVDQNGTPIEGFEYPIITTELDASQYTFIWTFEGVTMTGETSPLITAREPGTYTVSYNDTISGCMREASVTVVFDKSPDNLILTLTEGVFSQNNGIIANVTGGGPFEFSLDGGAFQESNRFDSVSLGIHEVTVAGGNNCGTITESILVLGFPNFFTPNNDGFNDFWNVIGDFEIPAMDIYIFDRYGKLLKQLDPNETGWDGIYNGVPLPATDYWFTAELKDKSEKYRSHFTLIR
ncbi:choice-of-anchor L domain-containing protein [Aquimarina sp. RZ0]|uniref:choice-of-anchor L domain-containing protein n=1 Tax=Aquimarina sp. RZ0 TaxID=2607730 RepID=UPI0011F0FF94|nr:choice-of-anchor L domain-containing protein [Aquimarina sp. RZ0]KAA1246390.1 T9SS type B sorting domain-containing protein [Aquimarina sp. RZ0]